MNERPYSIDWGNKGINKYRKALKEGTIEIVEKSGRQYLKIYRGIEVSDREVVSDDELIRSPNKIDLEKPGLDWSPIYSFARMHATPDYVKKWCILSALAPLDDGEILGATIHHNQMLDAENWGSYENRPITKISDALIVEVPPGCYGELLDIQIH